MNRHLKAATLGVAITLTVAVLLAASYLPGLADVSAGPMAADTATPAATAAAKPAATPAPTPTPLSLDQLSAIQPGLGTVMIEYGHRMSAMWFAGQAGNWDLASYQLDEMREIQEVGETTRPARAPALKSFESSFLDPLDKAISAKDKTQFQTAYTNAIQGCNSCHGAQTSSAFPQGYKFVKVQVPKDTLESIVSWSGQ